MPDKTKEAAPYQDQKLHTIAGDMPIEEFRRHGHDAIEWLARFLESIETRPVLPAIRPGHVIAQLPAQAPPQGETIEHILEDFDQIIVPALTHWNHPGFMAYFANTGSAPGILGELLTAGLNANAMLWKSAPAASELELVVAGWVRQLLGLPDDFFGFILDTASTSTLCALLAARHRATAGRDRSDGLWQLPPGVVYCSEQAHSSVERAAIAAGFGQRQVRKIPVDGQYSMRAADLRLAIDQDRADGRLPVCVVATVGTTSSTAIDPVPAIAEICRRDNVWLHVDAAYAGMAAILAERRDTLAGCDAADSLVVNPHKWLFTPMDCSLLYCRDSAALKNSLSLTPEYLRTAESGTAVNLMDYGFQLGRRFRALKLWMILRYYGVEGLRRRIRDHIAMAQQFAARLKACGEFEIMAPHPFSVVCFRYVAGRNLPDETLDALNERLIDAVNATGKIFLSHTRLGGRYVIRLAIGNIRTAPVHVERAFDLLCDHGRHLAREH